MKSKAGTVIASLAALFLVLGTVGSASSSVQAGSQVTPTATTAKSTQTEHENDVNEEHTDSDSENKADQTALAAQAKIAKADAISIAQNANADFTCKESELDSEKGTVYYALKGTLKNHQKIKINVNAVDGTITQEKED